MILCGDGVAFIYLGHTKSSDSDTLFLYSTMEEIFFPCSLIEKRKFYLSILFDHYSSNVLVIKILIKLFLL